MTMILKHINKQGYKIGLLCPILFFLCIPAAAKTVTANLSGATKETSILAQGIEKVIDANRRSIGNAQQGVALLDSLGHTLEYPYNLVATTLQARLLARVYAADADKYDRRELPIDEYPADCLAWSGRMFRTRVDELARGVWSNLESGAQYPVSVLGELVERRSEWSERGMTVADFLTLELVDALRMSRDAEYSGGGVIPFQLAGIPAQSESIPLSQQILESRIQSDLKCGRIEIASLLAQTLLGGLRGNEYNEYLDRCIGMFGDTPYCVQFMLNKYPDNAAALRQYMVRFPNARDIEELENRISTLTQKSVTVEYQQQIASALPVNYKITANNVDSLYILAMRLPDSYRWKQVAPAEAKQLGEVVSVDPIRIPADGKYEGKVIIKNPGVYILAASLTPDKGGMIEGTGNRNEKWNTVNVSSLSLINSTGNGSTDSYIYAVESGSMRPLKGVTVELKNKQKGEVKRLTTDADGKVKLLAGNWSCTAQSGGSVSRMECWNSSRGWREGNPYQSASVFTDLSVYHPADTVRFAVVDYEQRDRILYQVTHAPLRAYLMDTNYQRVDSVTMTTDSQGRCSGWFKLPERGLLGNNQIVIFTMKNGKPERQIGGGNFMVAEFKAPTLEISLKNFKTEYELGDTVSVHGDVTRFSGGPVSDTPVKYEIKFIGYPYWRSGSAASFKGEVKTNRKGEFSFELITSGLRDREFENGVYSLQLSAVNAEGETVFSPRYRFSIGGGRPVPMPVVVQRDLSREDTVPVGKSHVDLLPARSFTDSISSDAWTLVQVSDCNRVISRRWYRPGGQLSAHVKAPTGNNRVYVSYLSLGDRVVNGQREILEYQVTLIPEPQMRKLDIEATLNTGESVLVPGKKSILRIKVSENGKPMANLPVFAVLTDKGVNSVAPFRWEFNPMSMVGYPRCGSLWRQDGYNTQYRVELNRAEFKNFSPLPLPTFDFKGDQLYPMSYGVGMARNVMIRGSVKAPMLMKAASNDDAVEEMAMADGAISEENAALDHPQLRDGELSLGFFYPNLVTDADGCVEIPFTAPDFVGTWQLQVLSYDGEMRGAVDVRDIKSSKPVEVRINAPRFLRTGDDAELRGEVVNKTDAALATDVTIECVNPVNGNVIMKKGFDGVNLTAGAAAQLSSGFRMPGGVDCVELRIYATAQGVGDGEKFYLPVYPAVTPVVASQTFWLSPSQHEAVIPVEKGAEGAKMTLVYCDNPLWECVKGLPALMDGDGRNPLSLSYSLFCDAVGVGLTAKYPALSARIREISENAARESWLNANSELKTLMLDETPWVRDAQNDTLRLSRLARYLDRGKAVQVVRDLSEKLGKLQRPDGGWSWFEGGESSLFITESILKNLGRLSALGFPAPVSDRVITDGIRYADNCYVKLVKEYKGDKFSYKSMAGYIYIRSMFNTVPMTPEFKGIWQKGVAACREFDGGIYNVAEAALALGRAGMHQDGRRLLASIKKYATVSKQKGEWFDNLEYANPDYSILTVAKVLEAYRELNPDAPEVERLRQWLLLTGVSQSWGEKRSAADVIATLLATGVNTVSVDSKYDARIADGTIQINRTGDSPAWGAAVWQYQLPIAEVKSEGNRNLSIEKSIVRLSSVAGGAAEVAETLAVGDRVRVTLTLRNDIPLDYVAITDNRSAALLPVGEVSGYSHSDDVWFYREVKRGATNLFIQSLPKGVHIISYDCTVTHAGEYSLGIATVQSQYQPGFTAHSAGAVLRVK